MSDLNGTMMQGFHWYTSKDGTYWDDLARRAGDLAAAGITGIWMPPAYKGLNGIDEVGYAVYDLYDLGEFDQKGTVRTRYGTREQYLAAVKALQRAGLQVYADAVLNHRIGADGAELARATPFPQDDRIHPKGPLQDVKVYTHFHFPGRAGRYSDFVWHWYHFDAVDYEELRHEPGNVYLLEGKQFDDQVALEMGNFSFLLGCDLDFESKDVREELLRWGRWYLDTTGVDGLRLDAIKHISAWFFPEWLDAMERHVGKDLFVVGEYWTGDPAVLLQYLDKVGQRMAVFDVPLHYNMHTASRLGSSYDMRHLLDGSVAQVRPTLAVTFVDNHDSQPLQALESVVEPWFKPQAYALILLRQQGYPCIFHADYYGAEYDDRGRDGKTYHISMPSHRWLIDKFQYARRHYAFGPQLDYFDHWNRIGWTRLGDAEHPKAMAVLMTDGQGGSKWMDVRRPNATFKDLTEHVPEPVVTNEAGWGEFSCKDGSVSVWIQQ